MTRRHRKKRKNRKNKTRKRKGGDIRLQRALSSMFFLKKYIQELKHKKTYSVARGAGKTVKDDLVKFMENGRTNSKKIAKVLKKSIGIHTPCLMAALANQERCIFKNLVSSDDRGYVGEFKTIGMDKICSDNSIQKVISQWYKFWGSKRAGCGQTLMDSMMKISNKKNLKMDDYHKKAMEDPKYAKEYNDLMVAFAAVEKDEEEQKKLYGDDAYLLEVKNVNNPKEFEVTFGGRTRKKRRKKRKRKSRKN